MNKWERYRDWVMPGDSIHDELPVERIRWVVEAARRI